MLEQLIMIGTCFYGDGRQCGGMPLQDVMIAIAFITSCCIGLLIAYRRILRKETPPDYLNTGRSEPTESEMLE